MSRRPATWGLKAASNGRGRRGRSARHSDPAASTQGRGSVPPRLSTQPFADNMYSLPRPHSPRSVEARWASVSSNCGRQVWLAWGDRRACRSSGGQYRTRSGAVLLGAAQRGDQLPVAVDQLRSRGRRRFGYSATARDHGPLGRCSSCARDPEPGPSVTARSPTGLRSRGSTEPNDLRHQSPESVRLITAVANCSCSSAPATGCSARISAACSPTSGTSSEATVEQARARWWTVWGSTLQIASNTRLRAGRDASDDGGSRPTREIADRGP